MPVMARDFAIVDQYGWEYDYTNNHPAGAALDLGQLTSGESMRTSIVFSRISGLSRPVTLRYKDLGLDISA